MGRKKIVAKDDREQLSAQAPELSRDPNVTDTGHYRTYETMIPITWPDDSRAVELRYVKSPVDGKWRTGWAIKAGKVKDGEVPGVTGQEYPTEDAAIRWAAHGAVQRLCGIMNADCREMAADIERWISQSFDSAEAPAAANAWFELQISAIDRSRDVQLVLGEARRLAMDFAIRPVTIKYERGGDGSVKFLTDSMKLANEWNRLQAAEEPAAGPQINEHGAPGQCETVCVPMPKGVRAKIWISIAQHADGTYRLGADFMVPDGGEGWAPGVASRRESYASRAETLAAGVKAAFKFLDGHERTATSDNAKLLAARVRKQLDAWCKENGIVVAAGPDSPAEPGPGPAAATTPAAPLRVDDVPIAQIHTDIPNHRDPALEEANAKQLAESMRQNGQLQPIRVYERPAGGYTIGYGFSRLAAARLLGWPAIRAEIWPPAADHEIRAVQAIENLHRKDLSPAEEATAISDLVESVMAPTSLDTDPAKLRADAIRRAAELTGRPESWVRDRCYLMRLSPACRDAINQRRLPLLHARELAKIADHEWQDYLLLGERRPKNFPTTLYASKAVRKDEHGDGGMSIHGLQRIVLEMQRSLRGVPWKLDVEFAGKPACTTCMNNSANDANLFEHDEARVAPEHGTCLLAACFAAKQAECEKSVAKAVAKFTKDAAKDTEISPTAGTAAAYAPAYVKPAVVQRHMKRAVESPSAETPAKSKDREPAEHKPDPIETWRTGVVTQLLDRLDTKDGRMAVAMIEQMGGWEDWKLWKAGKPGKEATAMFQMLGAGDITGLKEMYIEQMMDVVKQESEIVKIKHTLKWVAEFILTHAAEVLGLKIPPMPAKKGGKK